MRALSICLTLILPSAVSWAADVLGIGGPEGVKYEPTSNYPRRNIEGWTVYVNHRLLEDQKELGRRTLRLLSVKLYDINREVPQKALEKLHQIPIWVELKHPRRPCACYHPDREWLIVGDFNPEKAGAVEIANAEALLGWTHQQPSMVLHELVHGYHHQLLGGYDHPEIAATYERAKQQKSYESVLHRSGRMTRAYALNNPQEYFAELSIAPRKRGLVRRQRLLSVRTGRGPPARRPRRPSCWRDSGARGGSRPLKNRGNRDDLTRPRTGSVCP